MDEPGEKKKGDEIHNNPKYAAMIESVDQSVGKILDKLDRLVRIRIFANRSQAIEIAIEEKLQRLEQTRLARECAKLNPDFEKVILITNQFGRDHFRPSANTELIVIDPEKPVEEISDEILTQLKGKVTGIELALNITSGSGKEHMAILSAVLKLGTGIRFVDVTETGSIIEL